MGETLTHRLVLPGDANHHGTLYAGALLRIALEAGYATAWRHVGADANLVLRRVHNLECLRPVPVGAVVEIRGAVLHQARAYVVTGLIGSPLSGGDGPWLEGLLGFAQIDADGRPVPIPGEAAAATPAGEEWARLADRLRKLLRVR
jgi:acyl-CoA hydrolase